MGIQAIIVRNKKYPSEFLGTLFINSSQHAIEQPSAYPCREHSQCTEKGERMWICQVQNIQMVKVYSEL